MLTSADLRELSHTQRVLLSPLSHPSRAAWMRASVDALRTLLRADRAVATLGGPGEEVFVADGVGVAEIEAYAADFAEADAAADLVLAHPEPFYVEADFAGTPAFEAHTASAVYNEWYRAHGLTRALGLLVLGDRGDVPDLYDQIEAPVVANVLLAGSPMSGGAGAERARRLLALVQPALAAGVAASRHADAMAPRIGAALDEAGATAWLYDETGACVFASARASGGGAGAREAAGRLAKEALRAARAGRPSMPTRAVAVGTRRLTLHASILDSSGRRTPAVLVVAKDGAAAPPQRLGLTPRQAEVARLLAKRLTNGEIAEALFISPHTARHHTEAVLRKLDVTDRRDVAEALLRG